jgi:hypothetical protein
VPSALPVLLLLTPLLGACAAKRPEREATPLMSQNMEQRFAASRKRMADPNDRSRFDPGIQSSLTRKGGSTMTGKAYKSATFDGSKSYTRTPAHKTPAWSGGNLDSGLGDAAYAQGGQAATVADERFKTTTSRLGKQQARQQDATFGDAGTTYQTAPNREALRSQEKNDRPVFIELEEHKRSPAYSEDQVRRLLGRQ